PRTALRSRDLADGDPHRLVRLGGVQAGLRRHPPLSSASLQKNQSGARMRISPNPCVTTDYLLCSKRTSTTARWRPGWRTSRGCLSRADRKRGVLWFQTERTRDGEEREEHDLPVVR